MTSFIRQTVYQFALVLALGTLHAQTVQLAPNMVRVCDEICTVTAAPANAVYQFGTGTSFSAPMTQVLPLFASCADPCPWFGGDPDVGIYKTLYVQQQATAFTVTWNNASGAVTTVIPGLPTAQSTVSATATASVPSTVTIPGQTATATAPAIPAGTILCNVPKNGGACKTPSTITLTKPLVTTATQTVPITSGTQTLHFSCTGVPMLADGQPDLRAPLNCTVTQ